MTEEEVYKLQITELVAIRDKKTKGGVLFGNVRTIDTWERRIGVELFTDTYLQIITIDKPYKKYPYRLVMKIKTNEPVLNLFTQ